ncbi:MAG TPA: hypothetical protein VK900_07240 [Anaerolineales bacterium]|nr:hypothetical protein [Anaerolineales bacterium]
MSFPARRISLILGLIFAFISIWIYQQLELPAPTGPYNVSRTMIRWVDTSRPEVLTEDPDDFREVVAVAWYPAEPETGVQGGYFPNLRTLSDELMRSGEVTLWEVLGLGLLRSSMLLDSDPVKEPFPVVILSPGNGTNIEFYSILASEIASHGYIVIGINHPYDVAAVELSDGEVAPYDKAQWALDTQAHQAYTAERIKVRTADVLFALGRLDEMNSTGPFAGAMDLDAIAVAGHSLGGITASEACKVNERFKACLNLDGLQAGGPFSMDETTLPPNQPFMFLTKEAQLHPRLLERFEAMTESYWIVVHGAAHDSFTDGPMLQSALLPGSSQANRVMEVVQKYSVAFLDHVLRGRSDEILSHPANKPGVSVRWFPSGRYK